MNTTVPPLDNVLVRRAVAHAIDEQAIIDLAQFGEALLPTGTTMPPFTLFGIDTNPYLGKNIDRARALLAEAGYPDGFDLEIVASTLSFSRGPAEVIQANLREAGIRATLLVEDVNFNVTRLFSGDFQASVAGTTNQPDPDDNLYNYFHSDGGTNLSMYSNPTLDQLLERGRLVGDIEERKRIYTEAQELILEEAIWAFLFYFEGYNSMREDVMGYSAYLNGGHLGMRYIWLAR